MHKSTATISHIESRRRAAQSVQDRVIKLLQWDEQQYCDFKFEMGLAYLHFITQGNEEQARLVSFSDLFWAWWKHAWTLRDEAFLRDFTVGAALGRTIVHPAYVCGGYRWLHDPEALAQESNEHGRLMGTSYAEMIGKFNRCIKVPTE